jgi:hypothetical protein
VKQKRILFINPSTERAIERVVHRALLSAGSEVLISNSCSDALQKIREGNYHLALVNYDEGGDETRNLVDQLLLNHDLLTVILSQKREKEHLIQLFSHDRLKNLIARNNELSESELLVTTEKLLRGDIFGVDKYLSWGTDLVVQTVSDSAQKEDQVKQVGEFVAALKCDQRFVRGAEIVADELIMNALYDAPVDKDGKPTFAHKPRTERVTLPKSDQATLTYGSDGRYFAISCRDRFGSLKAPTVVSYLKKCFTQDENSVNMKAGGAGVGLYMIFQSTSQMVINIDPKKATETLGLLDIRASYRDSKTRSKSLNIFLMNESEA